MKKEVETEEKNYKKIYILITLVVAILAVGVLLRPESNIKSSNKIVVSENIEPQKKPTTARIDITTPLVDADTLQFEVYVDGSETPETQAAWMPKFDTQGYVIQSDAGKTNIIIKTNSNIDLGLSLRGIDKRNDNNELIENWVQYTSFTINGEEILKTPIEVWHNTPYRYTISVKKGDVINIHAEWTEPENKEPTND